MHPSTRNYIHYLISMTESLSQKLYLNNRNFHFKHNSNLYCETFFIPDYYIYGLFDFRKNKNNFKTNLIIGSKNMNSFYIQEQFQNIDGYESSTLKNYGLDISLKDIEIMSIKTNGIEKNLLEIILSKNDKHILNCSCCHRY